MLDILGIPCFLFCLTLTVSTEVKKVRLKRQTQVQIIILLKSQGESWKGDLNHLNSVFFFLNHTVEMTIYGMLQKLKEQHIKYLTSFLTSSRFLIQLSFQRITAMMNHVWGKGFLEVPGMEGRYIGQVCPGTELAWWG